MISPCTRGVVSGRGHNISVVWLSCAEIHIVCSVGRVTSWLEDIQAEPMGGGDGEGREGKRRRKKRR